MWEKVLYLSKVIIMLRKIIKLLLILIWMVVIFLFSNDSGEASKKKSDHVIMDIYQVFNDTELTEKEKEQLIETVVYPTRKIAHFSEYFLLGLLVLSFLSEFGIVTRKSILIAIIICCLYAVSDEFHQMFSDGRTPKVFDVAIDTLGATTGIFLYSL